MHRVSAKCDWRFACLQVGWVFNQSSEERDFIMHTDEIKQVAMMQVRELCVCVFG